MSNLNMFNEQSEENISPIHLEMSDAEVDFYPSLFNLVESDALFTELQNNIDWKQEQIKFYGKMIDLPRLTAWYGDDGKSYKYSGITVEPNEWIETLLRIKTKIEAVSNVRFNSVLLNLYRGERDSVSWHSDDEPELGRNPVIGSVSFGAVRNFQFKHRLNPELRQKLDLTHGSFLLMKGPTQHFWQHQIPKTTKSLGVRINLTFRVIGA